MAVLLAGLYLGNVVVTDVAHPLFHQHEHEEVHTASAEQDPCHRAIYHGEKETGEAHHNHVSQVHEKCTLCDVIIHRDHRLTETPQFTSAEAAATPFSFYLVFSSFGSQPSSLTRGPPAIA